MIGYDLCVCGKRGWSSESKSRAATKKAGNSIRIYQCPKSALYHVTDSDKSQRLGKSRQVRAKRRGELRTNRHKTRAELGKWCA